MQRIERTRMLNEELQQLVKNSVDNQDLDTADESTAVAQTLYSIFFKTYRVKLIENARPHVPVYLQMLACAPEDRAAEIEAASTQKSRQELEMAHGDLARIFGSEDYWLEGDAELFDFQWAVPLVRQKQNKKSEDTGGVKVQKLKYRQQLLDLCLRIRPALTLDRANRFLTSVMREHPIRHRSPIDAIYYFTLLSGDALGDFDQQRAFVRDMLNQMAQFYAENGKNGDPQTSQSQQELKERQAMEKQRLREENAAAKASNREQTAALKAQRSEAYAARQKGEMSREDLIALIREIDKKEAALKQEKLDIDAQLQLEQQRMAAERARQHMIETATISQQFSDVEPGNAEEFAARYLGELPQMDLMGNHYSARRHLRENLEAIGVTHLDNATTFASDQLIQGRRKTESKHELYHVRLTGAGHATASVVNEMLLPEWQNIAMDFLSSCGGVLPADFPERELLMERFENSVLQAAEEEESPSPATMRANELAVPFHYGPFLYRALRKYLEKNEKYEELRNRVALLQDIQTRFCNLMEDDNILQFIASDYDYECIVGSNKKSWPKEDPSDQKSSRLEKITAKASKTFALNRNDVDDVPRSLLLLSELARIDQHLTENPEHHINATLIRCGYPALYARRKLDQFVLTTLACLRQMQAQGDAALEGIIDGLNMFLRQWLMEPMRRYKLKHNIQSRPDSRTEEIREKPRRPR